MAVPLWRRVLGLAPRTPICRHSTHPAVDGRIKFWFSLFLLSSAAALAQTPDPRTPEQMMVEAYRALMTAPAQVDKPFWAPERWYTRGAIRWIAEYESCRRASPPIWHASQGQPTLTDVDVTPVPPVGDDAQVLVSFKDRDRNRWGCGEANTVRRAKGAS